jgi:hypothetical protein
MTKEPNPNQIPMTKPQIPKENGAMNCAKYFWFIRVLRSCPGVEDQKCRFAAVVVGFFEASAPASEACAGPAACRTELSLSDARAMPEQIQFTPAAKRPDSFSHRDSLRFSRKNHISSLGFGH